MLPVPGQVEEGSYASECASRLLFWQFWLVGVGIVDKHSCARCNGSRSELDLTSVLLREHSADVGECDCEDVCIDTIRARTLKRIHERANIVGRELQVR